MIGLERKYTLLLPYSSRTGLYAFFQHIDDSPKLAPEGVVKIFLGHRGKKVSSS